MSLTSADLGDGTYRNPVLDADWSDPDVVRVGDDFYLTASSFGRAPGLPLLHSRDLVNWTLVGHALERLEPEDEYASPRHDCGVWAPSIRHHDDRFWIFWGDPDHGVHQVNAPAIRGPWTRPHLVKEGKGLIDPCPLWDDETGDAYLVHARAKSRSGIKNRLTGHRMHPDGTAVLDEGKVIVDGDRIPGWFTLEGPKVHRHDGWFWILAPAGGVETGWQGAFRSRDFFGPYEERVVLEQGDTDVNGPHQGGWVRTPAGEDWFLHFQQRGAYGRVVHLQPLRWGTDGWPVIGDEGAPVAVHAKPDLPPQPPAAPATDDDFPGGRYGRQWQWTANPRGGWVTRHSADGLRLTCVRSADVHDLRTLPNVLTQRLPGRPCAVEVELRLAGEEPGARAGLAVLGDAFSWIGLQRGADGTVHLVHRFAEQVAETERDAAYPQLVPQQATFAPSRRPARSPKLFEQGGPPLAAPPESPSTSSTRASGRLAESTHRTPLLDGRTLPAGALAPEGRARLRIEIGRGARCRFSYDLGEGFLPSGQVFSATPWRWVGALLGLFALAPAGEGHAGAATFTHFRITST